MAAPTPRPDAPRRRSTWALTFAIGTLALPASAAVQLSLDATPADPANPNAGGDWTLLAKTDDANGIAAIRATLAGIDDGAIADGDAADDVAFASGLGAIDPVQTSTGPRPPYLDLGAGATELIYGQDVSDGLSVVTGVGTPATGRGPDPSGDPAWDDATPIAAGTYPAATPAFVSVDANELDQASPPFSASAAAVTSSVRLVPEPGATASLAAGALATSALARRRRR